MMPTAEVTTIDESGPFSCDGNADEVGRPEDLGEPPAPGLRSMFPASGGCADEPTRQTVVDVRKR